MKLTSLQKYIDRKSAKREEVIQISRNILKNAKNAIYELHHDKKEKAEKLISEAKNLISKAEKILKLMPILYQTGMYSEALQEYTEAATYSDFISTGSIQKHTDLRINEEDYLAGLADLTGELSRRAVMLAIKHKKKDVVKIHTFVDNIYKEFLGFKFPNSLLRKKSDSIKHNLRKIENILYDLNLR